MITIATEIDLEPLATDAASGQNLLNSALPFLGSLQVDVLVQVGGASVSVAELLNMKKGSVIALDRLVAHPLDISVGGHVIARGTLVAIDEHFGVRISETVSQVDCG